MHFDLIDNSLEPLPTASYFLFVNLLNSDLGMGSDIPHSFDSLVAWFRQIDDAKRTLSKQVLQLIVRMNALSDTVTASRMMPSIEFFFISGGELDCLPPIFFCDLK